MTREVGGIIGKDITIRGEVLGSDDLLVEGIVEGTVKLDAELIVGEGGHVKADISAKTLTVEGGFDGVAKCSELVTLRSGAKVRGTIAAPCVVFEEDATFDGMLEMDVGLSEVSNG